MRDLFWPTDGPMARLAPFFPKSHGRPRADDQRVLSGIIFVRNGLRWRDAPAERGPAKTRLTTGGSAGSSFLLPPFGCWLAFDGGLGWLLRQP